MSTQFFNRAGQPFAPNATRGGKPGRVYDRICPRCGGAGGADKWAFTGWTCFLCGGRRTIEQAFERLFTAEQLAVLNERRDARRAKAQAAIDAKLAAERAQVEGERAAWEAANADVLAILAGDVSRNPFLADLADRVRGGKLLTEKQCAAVRAGHARDVAEQAAKAASRHVGTVGKRLEIDVTVVRKAGFLRENFARIGGQEWVAITTMRDAEGNTFVAKTPRFDPEKGSKLRIRATVKAHSAYQGEAQTEIQRVTVITEEAAVEAAS